MKTNLLLSTIVSLLLISTSDVMADERQEAASMEQLLAKVQKVVPPGWSVAFELSHPGLDDTGPYPALLIRSEKPLPLEIVNVPGLPGRSAGDQPDISQEIVSIRFIVSPYLTEAEYATVRKHNDALRQKRIRFGREQVKILPGNYKGGEPVPPHFIDPKTEQEAQLIRQYAFLWVSTEPRPLPTHHTEDLAFVMRYLPLEYVKIHDAKRAKEYTQIVGDLKEIILPYEPEP